MQKSSPIREIQETDLQSQSCFTEQSLLHLSNVTKDSCGAETVHPSCCTVEVKGGYSELCTMPSLCEKRFLRDKHIDELPGTDAIFPVKNVKDSGQCIFVERALNR